MEEEGGGLVGTCGACSPMHPGLVGAFSTPDRADVVIKGFQIAADTYKPSHGVKEGIYQADDTALVTGGTGCPV